MAICFYQNKRSWKWKREHTWTLHFVNGIGINFSYKICSNENGVCVICLLPFHEIQFGFPIETKYQLKQRNVNILYTFGTGSWWDLCELYLTNNTVKFISSLSHIRLKLPNLFDIRHYTKKTCFRKCCFYSISFSFCANALVVVVTVFDFHGIQKKGNK